MGRLMCGWVRACVDGSVDVWMGSLMCGWVRGCVDGFVDVWMGRWMNEWMDEALFNINKHSVRHFEGNARSYKLISIYNIIH